MTDRFTRDRNRRRPACFASFDIDFAAVATEGYGACLRACGSSDLPAELETLDPQEGEHLVRVRLGIGPEIVEEAHVHCCRGKRSR